MTEKPVLKGKGHELLSLFDIEYHASSAKITDVLMGNPNKKFKLSLEKIPLGKTKAPKYIQPEPAKGE